MKQQRNDNGNNKIIMQFLSNLYIKSQRKIYARFVFKIVKVVKLQIIFYLN
jgi:hypothetical protein